MVSATRSGEVKVHQGGQGGLQIFASQLQPRSRAVDMCSTVTKEALTRLHMSAHDCHCKNS